MWLAIIQYKFGAKPLFVTENNYFNLAIPLLLIIPYNLIFKQLFNHISAIEIDRRMNDKKYKALRTKAIFIYLSGILLNSMIPWAMDRIIPSFV